MPRKNPINPYLTVKSGRVWGIENYSQKHLIMEKLSRKELAQRAAQIFERKPELQDIVGTQDAQFFLNDPNNLGAVISHCKENGLEYYTITRDESLNPQPESSEEEKGEEGKEKPLNRMNKSELVAKATSLGIEFAEDTTNKDLIALIEAKLTSAE